MQIRCRDCGTTYSASQPDLNQYGNDPYQFANSAFNGCRYDCGKRNWEITTTEM